MQLNPIFTFLVKEQKRIDETLNTIWWIINMLTIYKL